MVFAFPPTDFLGALWPVGVESGIQEIVLFFSLSSCGRNPTFHLPPADTDARPLAPYT